MKQSFFILLFVFSMSVIHAASDKQLEKFSSLSTFYTAGISANINAQIDNVVFTEGSSSLKVQYSLNGIVGNFVEVYRSYNTSTLDLSFNPSGLSIKVLGTSGNTDVFKFMLYEDQNMNGNPPMINKPQKVGSQCKIFPLKTGLILISLCLLRLFFP